jgi:membrane protease YdiL (CAAX protease family)
MTEPLSGTKAPLPSEPKPLFTEKKPRPIASWWHLAGFLAIVAGIAYSGWRAQHTGIATDAGGAAATPAPGQLGTHAESYRFYLVSIAADWAFFYYCWVGVHWRGGTLATLTGSRWPTWRQLTRDIAIAIPFWLLWEAVAYGALYATSRFAGADTARSAASLLPKSAPEVLVWMLVCVTAGFTEEIQCRGYLQQQLHALTGSVAAAVVLQGLVFGVQHSYQGWQHVTVIAALGILYGALAAWRKNLRANMLAHAWSDVWEGWLKFIVMR